MKNLLLILVLLVFSQTYSQSEIENPHYSYSIGQGRVTKVELLENATVLHFDVTLYTNKPCKIPSASYIQPVNSDEKYFVTGSEGVVLDVEFEVPGKLRKKYKLMFPKLPEHVTHVKFDEFEQGTWEIHDLEVRGFKNLPKELVGNWLNADGSNLWHHSFYNNKAIVDRTVWQYKSVEKDGEFYKISLENSNEQKTMYAKVKNKELISFGNTKKMLIPYTTKKSFNKKNKLNNDEVYTESNLFKTDSATYSGIIANYSKNSNYKTGSISVNNVFTGSQETYLVEIEEDGSFSVKFPMHYPQEIYIRFPSHSASIFVEPGKETWNLIQSSDVADSFYSENLALVNTQLNHFVYSNRTIEDHMKLREKNILPEDYKKLCYAIYDKNAKILDSVVNNSVLSKKVIQIMQLNLEFQKYENLISYEIYHERGDDKDAKYLTDSTYMDFLSPKILDNKLATLTSDFSGLINRLRFSKHIKRGKNYSVKHPQVLELAEIMKEKGQEITVEEQELIDSQLQFKINNAVALEKQKAFREVNNETLMSFSTKFSKVYQKVPETQRQNLFSDNGFILDTIAAYAKTFDIVFSDEEISIIKAQKTILNEEEKQSFKDFYTKELNEKNQAFTKKYYHIIREFVDEQLKEKNLEMYTRYFRDKPLWVSDLIFCQALAGPIKDQVTPLSDSVLAKYSSYINNEFVKQQLYAVNSNTIAKIEDNKSKTGYVLNETPNAEADKIFEAIIEKYKGKVVFIDFWATWCGPCRSGMTRMKPLKEELKSEEIVFVYITNPSSPEKTYQNMIPDIKGEHYRVSSDDWNYLKEKFKITGIPHYALVNKEGVVVKDKIYFSSSNEEFKKLLEAYL
ncbi:TlpA family protein disulfide reductase [Mariniflexile sp.]|uniref:TlpA family protein disulfide reductase n=1 Tax=Mariniflexile sp. TaxID=1979402 RepID=UPI003562FE73